MSLGLVGSQGGHLQVFIAQVSALPFIHSFLPSLLNLLSPFPPPTPSSPSFVMTDGGWYMMT